MRANLEAGGVVMEAGTTGSDTPTPERAGRVIRVALVAFIVLGLEWRLAHPARIANDPDLWPTPWAMLFILVPVALGIWAFEATSQGRPGLKVDGLWGLLVGTLCYVALSILG